MNFNGGGEQYYAFTSQGTTFEYTFTRALVHELVHAIENTDDGLKSNLGTSYGGSLIDALPALERRVEKYDPLFSAQPQVREESSMSNCAAQTRSCAIGRARRVFALFFGAFLAGGILSDGAIGSERPYLWPQQKPIELPDMDYFAEIIAPFFESTTGQEEFTPQGTSAPFSVKLRARLSSGRTWMSAENCHSPALTNETDQSPEQKGASEFLEVRYLKAIGQAIQLLQFYAPIKCASEAGQANIYVDINLAETADASTGFERMSDAELISRSSGGKELKNPRIHVLTFPWSVVRVVEANSGDVSYRSKEPIPRIFGGDVWLEYPIRTEIQEQLFYSFLGYASRPEDIFEGNEHWVRVGIMGDFEHLKTRFAVPGRTTGPGLLEAYNARVANAPPLVVGSKTTLAEIGDAACSREFHLPDGFGLAGCSILHTQRVRDRLLRSMMPFFGFKAGSRAVGDANANSAIDAFRDLKDLSLKSRRDIAIEFIRDQLGIEILKYWYGDLNGEGSPWSTQSISDEFSKSAIRDLHPRISGRLRDLEWRLSRQFLFNSRLDRTLPRLRVQSDNK